MNYIEMNREERYFCFLLGHALLSSKSFRHEFCDKIGLNADRLEVYPEAAWLRDYWHALDYENVGGVGRKRLTPPEKRTESRKTGLRKILDIALDGNAPRDFDADFYWSSGKNRVGEIISPGRWPLKELEQMAPVADQLAHLKWAFNAKPDLMLVSTKETNEKMKDFCLIEAKVESDEDKYSHEGITPASQTEIQKLIGRLITGLSVDLQLKDNIMLSRQTEGPEKDVVYISWEEIIEMVEFHQEKLDDFTVNGFLNSPFLRKL